MAVNSCCVLPFVRLPSVSLTRHTGLRRARHASAGLIRYCKSSSPHEGHVDSAWFDVVVVGGGFAGLAALSRLCRTKRNGRSTRILLVEQGRGLGGRVPTRRAESSDGVGPCSFDHGCQYMSAKDSHPNFSEALRAWQSEGVIAPWGGSIGVATLRSDGRVTAQGFKPFNDSKLDRIMVGIPTMSAVGKHVLAEARKSSGSLEVRCGLKASDAAWDADSGRWNLQVGGDLVSADALAVTTSAGSCVKLLGAGSAAGRIADAVTSDVCWALMVAFPEPLSALLFDGAVFEAAPGEEISIAWAARNSSKPGRPSHPECWVLHAAPVWSNSRADWSRDDVKAALLQEFRKLSGYDDVEPVYLEAFRWNNAFPLNAPVLSEKCVVEETMRMVAGGDWAVGNRVGDAYESGVAVAAALEGMLKLDS